MVVHYDWQRLESKLSLGIDLHQACLQLDIPFDDAKEYVERQLEDRCLDDWCLHKSAHAALQTGLEQLQRIAQAGPMETEFEDSEDIQDKLSGDVTKIKKTKKVAATDLEAAKALVRFGLDARKLVGSMARKTAGNEAITKDLWDLAQESDGRVIHGPWNLKKVK